MPRNISVQLIVHPGENSMMTLHHAVAEMLEAKGFKVALPVTNQDPMTVEWPEPIPPFSYGTSNKKD